MPWKFLARLLFYFCNEKCIGGIETNLRNWNMFSAFDQKQNKLQSHPCILREEQLDLLRYITNDAEEVAALHQYCWVNIWLSPLFKPDNTSSCTRLTFLASISPTRGQHPRVRPWTTLTPRLVPVTIIKHLNSSRSDCWEVYLYSWGTEINACISEALVVTFYLQSCCTFQYRSFFPLTKFAASPL